MARARTIIAGYNPELVGQYESANPAAVATNASSLISGARSAGIGVLSGKVQPDFVDVVLKFGASIYNCLSESFAIVTTAAAIFRPDSYIKAASKDLSTASLADLYSDRDYVLDSIEWWRRHEIREDISVVTEILTNVDIAANSAKLISFIRSQAVVNRFTIELLRKMSTAGVQVRQVAELIDEEKNRLLGAGRVKLQLPAPQQPLVRFGLLPFTISMTLAEIVKVMAGAETLQVKARSAEAQTGVEEVTAGAVPSREEIHEAFSKLHHQVIVLDCSRQSTIEFDARGLISLDYLTENDLLAKKQSGLTKKILVRYNTVRQVGDLDGPKPTSAPAVFVIGEPTEHTFVVQMLTPAMFKLLSNNDQAIIDSSSVRGIAAGLSTRAAEYGRVCEGIILENIFDPGSANLQVLYADATDISLPGHILKADIARDFSIHFERLFEKQLPDGNAEFVRAVTNEATIVGILTRRLISQLASRSNEFLVSYIYKFDALSRQFARELIGRTKKYRPSELVYKELRPTELRKHLHGICMTIIDEVIYELDRAKTWDEIDKSLKEFFIERKMISI